MQRIIKTILLVLFFIWGINCINGSKNSLPFFAYLDLSTKGGNSFAIAQITPGSGVSDIPLNTSIQATFNSAFDSSSVTSSTFFLKKGGDPILATLRLDKNTAVLTPNSALSASTTYSVTISKEIKSEEGISLKEDLTWNFTTATIIDAVAPALSLRIPAAGAALISNTTSVQVAFTETMDCTTVDNVSLALKNNATNTVELSGVNCLGSSATLSPNNPLTPNTTYRVEVSASMKDLANNPLPGPQNWTFTTGAGPDNTPPALSFASPSPGETGISVNSAIGVAFDEPINCGSVPGNFTLDDPLIPGNIGVVLNCSGATASITPVAAAGLAFNTTYRTTLTAGIMDLSSNPITPRTWTFTTGAAPDLTQPTVTFTVPTVNATGVGVNINPTVVFSEPMACGTVNAASFRLKQQATGVYLVGNVACFGTSATWTPDPVNPFAFNTTYTVEINAGARDSANLPAIPFSWNFTTGPGPDLTAPSVAFVTPTNGSTGLPINSGGSIAFDETMNCGTVLGSISMDDDITTPLSTVPLNINCNGNTATFAPVVALAFNTTYTVTVAPTATDASGNLIGVYSWSFTTGAAPDVTPPQISLVSPLPGATGISTNSNITVSFNETIDCSTLNLTVNNGIFLTKNCSGASATFTTTVPTPFNAGTNYAVTLVTVKDLQGNTILPGPSLTWNFTTGLAPDVTPPTIAIQNLRTNSTIESGFVIGTAADARGIASIEISIDGGGFTGAGIIGTTSWKYPLPTGAATWRSNSQHTIQVKATDTSNNVTTSAMITVKKGTNKDINGDGYSDLVTAEYGQGLVYIFHSSGAAAGITTTSAPFASRTIVGNAAIRFGKTVATGDVNGDGFADVIVGAPTDVVGGAPVGRVYIFHSSGTNGVIASFSGFANNTLTGNLNADRFGDALATGDINGDGYTDVIVGAPGYNASMGRIYVFHSTGGAGITTATVNGAGAGASSFKTGSATGDRFGYFISTGNMNGNTGGGFSDDIAVGAPGFNNGFGDDWGRVYIYYGSTPGGLTAVAPNTITNNTADTNNVAGFPGGPALFGASVSVADIDGDGFCDVVVGAPLFTQASVLPAGNSPLQGRVAVFLAGAGIGGIANTTVGAANRAINGIVNGQTIGMSLTVKDLDSDGRADIVLTSVNPNAVQVFMTPTVGGIGPVSADTNTASVTIAGVPGLGFSGSFAGAPGVPSPSSSLSNGDINGDGLIDLIIGGTNNAVRVFHSVGGATPVTNNPAAASSIILDSGLVGGIGGVGANSNEFGAGLY